MTLRLGGDGAITGCTSLENPDLTVSGLTISGSFDAEKVLVASGTAAAPSYTFSGDTDNGLYYAGTNSIGLSTAGTNAILIDSTGNVGIGTTSPSANLHVAAPNNSQLFLEATDTSPTTIILETDAGTSERARINNKDGEITFDVGNTSEALRIDSSGRLLVGTSSRSDTAKLVVQGNVSSGSDGGILALSSSYGASIGGAGAYTGQIKFTDSQGGVFGNISCQADGVNATNDYPGRLVFSTTADGASSPTERMRIDSSGNVNFPSTDPIISSAYNMYVKAPNNIEIIGDSDSSGNGIIDFRIGASSRARIDSSGRLLVGTSSARTDFYGSNGFQLQVEGTEWYNSGISSVCNDSQYGGYIALGRSRGSTLGSTTIVQNNDTLGTLDYLGADGNQLVLGARIRAEVDGTPGNNDMPGRLVFSTTADGASSPTERMRIKENGWRQAIAVDHVETLSSATSAGTVHFLISGRHSGTIGTPDSGTICYTVFTNGNVVNTNNSYGPISDVKLKENIVDANSQWDDLKALRVVNFNFKQETGYETHKQLGFIAQEVEQVSPSLVYDTPDRDEEGNNLGTVTKVIQTSVLYTKAVKALQEAMERIEQLETSNADLLARVSALEAS